MAKYLVIHTGNEKNKYCSESQGSVCSTDHTGGRFLDSLPQCSGYGIHQTGRCHLSKTHLVSGSADLCAYNLNSTGSSDSIYFYRLFSGICAVVAFWRKQRNFLKNEIGCYSSDFIDWRIRINPKLLT